nr:uncharacterized protein LOC100183362 isoform X2 [Ciona intestinalis]|eukprot:XP_002127757.1 uncharacterized protein LOC100183362 isoform X2 [Ciona intestinalis]
MRELLVRAADIRTPKMPKSERVCKLLNTVFGEFLGRCILLGLCGVTIWRLHLSDPKFPHWGYALLSIGILLSIVDCLQSLWYKSKIYGYWHFYKYIHWNGRTWFDPNTLFCLLTIIPVLICTELAIYNFRQQEILSGSAEHEFGLTTEQPNGTFLEMTTVHGSGDGLIRTMSTASNYSTTVGLSVNSTLQSSSTPLPKGRDFSLYILHDAACILVVLVRFLIRKPEGLPPSRHNLLLFEMLLNAVDLSTFIVSSLDQEIIYTDLKLLIAVIVFWGLGFLSLVLVVSRRFADVEFETDRKKLETLYCIVQITLQELPRLVFRILILVWANNLEGPTISNDVLFACKNAFCMLLFCHRIFITWRFTDTNRR